MSERNLNGLKCEIDREKHFIKVLENAIFNGQFLF